MERHKHALGHAFRRAVEIDDLMWKNPMRAVSLPAVASAVCPERGADKQKRLPFTLAEIHRLIHELSAPWCDMVAVSWYTGGLRLSDVCLMRWASIDWAGGYISLVEKKTRKERCQKGNGEAEVAYGDISPPEEEVQRKQQEAPE